MDGNVNTPGFLWEKLLGTLESATVFKQDAKDAVGFASMRDFDDLIETARFKHRVAIVEVPLGLMIARKGSDFDFMDDRLRREVAALLNLRHWIAEMRSVIVWDKPRG